MRHPNLQISPFPFSFFIKTAPFIHPEPPGRCSFLGTTGPNLTLLIWLLFYFLANGCVKFIELILSKHSRWTNMKSGECFRSFAFQKDFFLVKIFRNVLYRGSRLFSVSDWLTIFPHLAYNWVILFLKLNLWGDISFFKFGKNSPNKNEVYLLEGSKRGLPSRRFSCCLPAVMAMTLIRCRHYYMSTKVGDQPTSTPYIVSTKVGDQPTSTPSSGMIMRRPTRSSTPT